MSALSPNERAFGANHRRKRAGDPLEEHEVKRARMNWLCQEGGCGDSDCQDCWPSPWEAGMIDSVRKDESPKLGDLLEELDAESLRKLLWATITVTPRIRSMVEGTAKTLYDEKQIGCRPEKEYDEEEDDKQQSPGDESVEAIKDVEECVRLVTDILLRAGQEDPSEELNMVIVGINVSAGLKSPFPAKRNALKALVSIAELVLEDDFPSAPWIRHQYTNDAA